MRLRTLFCATLLLLVHIVAVNAQSYSALSFSPYALELKESGLFQAPLHIASGSGEPRSSSEMYAAFRPLSLSNGLDSVATDSAGIKPEINIAKLSVIGGALLTGMTIIHIYQENGWWQNNRTSFHFQEDLSYGLWVDKLGHFHGASGMTYVIAKSLQWANVEEEDSWWWGAGGALLFQTFLEVEDGFSRWGFDRVDFAADVAGVAWPLAKRRYKALEHIDFKFSYHPSDLLNRSGGAGFEGQQHIVMDDYEGQTFWVSTHIKPLIPEPAKGIIPDFLCLALGYGARDIVGTNSEPYGVWLIGFDLDMTKILPMDIPFFKTTAEVLNHFHLPMPAVQFSPHAIWYGLYF